MVFKAPLNAVSNISSINLAELDRLTDDIASDLMSQIQWGLESPDGTRHGKINFMKDLSGSFSVEEIQGYKHVVSDSAYVKFVEYGMPPGNWVNFDALAIWVYHKLGITDEDENLSVTWKILRKIQANGIKPRRFVKKAIRNFIRGNSVPSKRKMFKFKPKAPNGFARLSKKLKNLKASQKKTLKKINRKLKKIINKKNLNKVDRAYKKVRKYR